MLQIHSLDKCVIIVIEFFDNEVYMIKVIKCRTQDKFDHIKWAYSENLISETQYNRFEEMIKSDYKNAMLYIFGQMRIMSQIKQESLIQ